MFEEKLTNFDVAADRRSFEVAPAVVYSAAAPALPAAESTSILGSEVSQAAPGIMPATDEISMRPEHSEDGDWAASVVRDTLVATGTVSVSVPARKKPKCEASAMVQVTMSVQARQMRMGFDRWAILTTSKKRRLRQAQFLRLQFMRQLSLYWQQWRCYWGAGVLQNLVMPAVADDGPYDPRREGRILSPSPMTNAKRLDVRPSPLHEGFLQLQAGSTTGLVACYYRGTRNVHAFGSKIGAYSPDGIHDSAIVNAVGFIPVQAIVEQGPDEGRMFRIKQCKLSVYALRFFLSDLDIEKIRESPCVIFGTFLLIGTTRMVNGQLMSYHKLSGAALRCALAYAQEFGAGGTILQGT